MKAVQFSRYGRASEVAELVDVPEPAPPGGGEVLVEVLAAPINPSDLLHFAGRYATRAELPSYAGGGVLARVVETGRGVGNLAPGDRMLVVSTGRNAWRERFIWPAEGAFALPEGDAVDLSLLAANPPTALLMLESFASLQPGDWVIQNAANSSVGVSLIQLARAKQLRTVNVVRRENVISELTALGADIVLVDGPDLNERVATATRGAPVRLAIDAIAGPATRQLAGCVANGGIVVNYGLLSGQPCEVDSADVLFRGVSLKGFWYAGWVSQAGPGAVSDLFGRLLALSRSGALRVPVEAVYPVAQLREALAHAEREGRMGKVVVRWSSDRPGGKHE